MSAHLLLRRVALSVLARGGSETSTVAAVSARMPMSSLCRSQQQRILRPLSSGILPKKSGLLLPFRHFATRSAADGYLVDLLKSEIEHELHEEANLQSSLKGSAGPFELSDKPGTEEVILRRTFGNEQIAVTCLVETEFPDEDVEPDEEEPKEQVQQGEPVDCLHLNVSITKGSETPVLEIDCVFYRGATDVMIEAVSFLTDLSTDESGKKPEPYEGPSFEDLDENLQRAFHDLLKARGLTPRVATYVIDYLNVKEHREYMRWLHNVEVFFES